jgi:hypothetical protein
MNKQQAAQMDQALKGIAQQLKENHDQALQVMTNQLTVLNNMATILSESQCQCINEQANDHERKDDAQAQKQALLLIKTLKIN